MLYNLINLIKIIAEKVGGKIKMSFEKTKIVDTVILLSKAKP